MGRPPAIKIGSFRSKRGDFDIASGAGPMHQDHTKTGPDGPSSRMAENGSNLFRPGVRGDVIVFGSLLQQQVPHAAAGPIRLITGAPQASHHIDRKLARWVDRAGHLIIHYDSRTP